jgi:hypothetical protein
MTGQDGHARGSGERYLLFAGSQQRPNGGLGDLVETFTSEEAARNAFLEIRLRTSAPTSWAQLAVLDESQRLKPVCWFGIGAEPDRQPRVPTPGRKPAMVKTTTTEPMTSAPTRSRTFTVGLAICALLALADVAMAFDVSDDAPPMPVLISGALLGLITLYGVRRAWTGSRRGLPVIVVSRVLSVLSGVPAFFVDDAPEWAPPVVAVCIVMTVAGLGLVLRGVRQPAASMQLQS